MLIKTNYISKDSALAQFRSSSEMYRFFVLLGLSMISASLKSQAHQNYSVAVACIPGLVLKLQKKKRRAKLVFSEPGDRKNREGAPGV